MRSPSSRPQANIGRPSSRRVAQLVDSLPIAASLRASLMVTNQVLPVWQRHVDPTLQRHTEPAHFADGVLVISADSPVWANLLRHQQQSILRLLHRNGLTMVQHLHIRTSPTQKPPPAPRISRETPDPDVTDSIARSADSIDDTSLRDALKRLAATLEGLRRDDTQTRK